MLPAPSIDRPDTMHDRRSRPLAHRGPNTLAVLAALVALVGLHGCGSEDGRDDCVSENFCVAEQPRLAATPSSLSFSVVALGQSADAVVTLRNTGDADLEITDMALEGADAAMFVLNGAPGTPYDGRERVLPPGVEVELQVVYTPQRVGSAEALLCIESNDPITPRLCLDIVALDTGPRPQVTPAPVLFGQVEAGAEAAQEVTITNVGSADLHFVTEDADGDGTLEATGIALRGSPDFSPAHGTRDAVLHAAIAQPLAPGESMVLELFYRPPMKAPDEGKLVLTYLYGDEPRTHETDISANADEPCVRVVPDEIDFGQAAVGTVAEKIAAIENCGSATLTLSKLALSDDSAPELGLSSIPQALADGGTLDLDPGQLRQFYVTFAPTAEVPSTGTLVVESNDGARPRLEVLIFGVGSNNNCPVAGAQGQIVRDARDQPIASPAAPASELETEALSTLRLRPTGSSDPDGDAIVGYQWSIVEAPPGFSLSLSPSATAEEVEIQLALIGDYVFELDVTDARGASACAPARVMVSARSDKRLVIELTWRTPSDLDETDIGSGLGTDLDLHLRNGALVGAWDDAFTGGNADCYFANPRPQWGSASSVDDDPALDRDDIDGGGPEQINIREPARTDGNELTGGYSQPYQVGVYFYDDFDFAPPVYASLRVYLDGASVPAAAWPSGSPVEGKRLDTADPTVSRGGDFWLAGEIEWGAAGGTLREIDSMHTGFP